MANNPARRRFIVGAVVLLIVGGLLLLGWLPKHRLNEHVMAKSRAAQSALPTVEVEQVRHASAEQNLMLPGTVTPLRAAHIYARAAGYVQSRHADLGDQVRKGQLLAVLSVPELDSTVAQSDAVLQQMTAGVTTAEANLQLQQATYARVHTLVGHGILSQQEDDTARAALESARAGVAAAQQAVGGARSALLRSRVLAGFAQVRSPIDGTVTQRNVEVGALVSPAGAAQGATSTPGTVPTGGPATGGAQGGELFYVVDLRSLVVDISAPEADALFLEKGQPVELAFSEMAGKKFGGKITRTSDSLSQQTRTLLAEVQVDDPDHRLRPGMYGTATVKFKAPNPGILVPGDSLLTMARGQFVPVVEGDVIHLRPVTVGRDLGTQFYVTEGLKDGDTVVLNPTDMVAEGVRVKAVSAPAGQTGEQAKPGGAKTGSGQGSASGGGQP